MSSDGACGRKSKWPIAPGGAGTPAAFPGASLTLPAWDEHVFAIPGICWPEILKRAEAKGEKEIKTQRAGALRYNGRGTAAGCFGYQRCGCSGMQLWEPPDVIHNTIRISAHFDDDREARVTVPGHAAQADPEHLDESP
jgi:hypothetical protein